MKRVNTYLQKLKSLEILFEDIRKDITYYVKNRFEDLTVKDLNAVDSCVNEKLPEAIDLIQKLKWQTYKIPEGTIVNVDDLLVDLELKSKKIEELLTLVKRLEKENAIQDSPNKDLQIEVLMLRDEKINKARIANEVRTDLIKQGFAKAGVMIKLIDRIIKA